MHIAILVTNTDDSDFARRHPRDPEKFEALLAPLRPDWTFEAFEVKDGDFPDDIGRFDGVIITGSPASIRDGAPWMARLEALIAEMVERRLPLFGACFGHQAIARALGGTVGPNPGGWNFGHATTNILAETPWTKGETGAIGLYTAHSEQVTEPPRGAVIVAGSPQCPVGGMRIGDTVFTTQYHPEMSAGFIAELLEEEAGHLGPDVAAKARLSLKEKAETERFARWVVAFFEHAAGLRAGEAASASR